MQSSDRTLSQQETHCWLMIGLKEWCLVEKAMAPHSSTLAWKIPWMEEPGGLQSMGSLGVGHYWATSLSLFTSMHWRRKWQPTPVFLPGESQGRGRLVGCRLGSHRVGHDWSDLAAAAAMMFRKGPKHEPCLERRPEWGVGNFLWAARSSVRFSSPGHRKERKKTQKKKLFWAEDSLTSWILSRTSLELIFINSVCECMLWFNKSGGLIFWSDWEWENNSLSHIAITTCPRWNHKLSWLNEISRACWIRAQLSNRKADQN